MKKFVMGLVVGLMVSFAFTAHAQVTTLIGKVIDSSYSVTVNGHTLEKEAIAIQGTSYLPVRAMAEIVGMDVKFDSKAGIELVEKKGEAAPVNTSNPTDGPSVEYQLSVVNRKILETEEQILVNKSFKNDLKDESKKAVIQVTIDNLEKQLADLKAEKAKLEAP